MTTDEQNTETRTIACAAIQSLIDYLQETAQDQLDLSSACVGLHRATRHSGKSEGLRHAARKLQALLDQEVTS